MTKELKKRDPLFSLRFSSSRLGPYCNCSSSVSTTNMAMCVRPGSVEPCSGHGDCLCGHCVCYNPEQYEGPYCEFDKTQCQRHGGFLCNGEGLRQGWATLMMERATIFSHSLQGATMLMYCDAF